MNTLYLECNMGAAGDMLMAALLELLPTPEDFIAEINALGLPGVQVTRETATKCGIVGTHIRVTVAGQEEQSCDVEAAHTHDENTGHAHHTTPVHTHTQATAHTHRGMAEMKQLIASLPVSARVKTDALAVYRLIADAEAKAHGRTVDEVHFHEVGALDAVADVVGVCLLIEQLAPARIVASPIQVGSGQVHCAHGILPVPTPATASILQGIPSYGGSIRGELCTPTGAALLRHFATSFGPQPLMATQAIGYGMGNKDFPVANCVRAFLGEEAAPLGQDAVAEICCNLDDMTGEALGYAQEVLLEGGALDVFTLPIQMKKNRPGTLLCCLCRAADAERMAVVMLQNTTTLGVRTTLHARHTLQSSKSILNTEFGPVRLKTSQGYGTFRAKPEYEDVAKIARENRLSMQEVRKKIDRLL